MFYQHRVDVIYYCPHILGAIFLVVLAFTDVPAKSKFLVRASVALAIACFLAHVNRIFNLVPDYLYFPSGHMTSCLGISVSLAMLRPWSLFLTVPFLIIFGDKLVAYQFHSAVDVLGAIPLVAIVYGLIHHFWRLTPAPKRVLA